MSRPTPFTPLTVRLCANYDYPNLLRQTPGGEGLWHNIRFTFGPVDNCDYLIVLNHPKDAVDVFCDPGRIWTLIQEPPDHVMNSRFGDSPYAARVYTPDGRRKGKRFIHSHTALPWHVERDFDRLLDMSPPPKTKELSWITSNLEYLAGHKQRMRFLDRIKGELDFDLYGKGFQYIPDKWDALAPYRYAIAVENFRNDYYWTEKIADCFLSWTVPIYCGCRRIDRYFPKNSMMVFDIDDPNAPKVIQAEIDKDDWNIRREALAEARRRVLFEHQLFPFLEREILSYEREKPRKKKRWNKIKPNASWTKRTLTVLRDYLSA